MKCICLLLWRSKMNHRDAKRIDEAFTIAQTVPRVASSRIFASLYYKSRLISSGFNSVKTHPMQKNYGKNPNSICLHAEVTAIKNALRTVDLDVLSKSVLYVARAKNLTRFSKKFVWGMAKPCVGCQRCISDFSIKRTFYTTDEQGVFKCL